MPYAYTPRGTYIWVDDDLSEAEQRAEILRYDSEFCAECEESPCDCPDYNDDVDYERSYSRGELLPWNYAPPGGYEFHGEGPAYYGLEIEITSDNSYETLDHARSRLDTNHGTLGFLKQDGSVNGFEMVTPPMSYEWAMANWPWTLLPELREYDCRAVYDDNGIHVHVSREAFSSPAHVFRWMKLFYRNQYHIERVARRHSGQWAAFSGDHRSGHFAHAMKHGKNPHAYTCDEQMWNRLTTRDGTQHNRYSAINTTNEHTFEVRVFASTLSITKAQRALQLVAASVEYTRGARGTDGSGRRSWDWDRFRDWLQLNETTYQALADGEYAAIVKERGVAA